MKRPAPCRICGKERLLKGSGQCDTCYQRVRRLGMVGIEVQLGRGDVLCDICRKHPGIAVDHDHTTGQARGRLCRACNVGLGCFRDDPRLLAAASLYILTVKETGNSTTAPRRPMAPKLVKRADRAEWYAWITELGTNRRVRRCTGEIDVRRAQAEAERMQNRVTKAVPFSEVPKTDGENAA